MSDFSVVYVDTATGNKLYLDKAVHSGVAQFKYIQNVEASVWTLYHKQASDKFVLSITDENGSKIYPNHVKIFDEDTITIDFSSPIKGQAILIFFDKGIVHIEPSPTPSSSVPSPTASITPSSSFNSSTGGTVSTDQTSLVDPNNLTLMTSGNADDDSFGIGPLPFDFYYGNVNYGHGLNGGIFVGSNGYITFGFSSTQYSSFSATNPGKSLMIQADDNSWQQIFQASHAANDAFTVRYEGTNSTGGTVGNSNMIWELTFYKNQKMQLVIGSMARSDGVCGLSNGTQYMDTTTFVSNTSYAISDANGDSGTGTAWNVDLGSIIGASGYAPAPTPTPTPTISVTPTITPTISVTPSLPPYSVPNYIQRLNSSGTLDTTFANIAPSNQINQILPANDGSFYLTGYFSDIGGVPYNRIARLHSNGTLDTTFVDPNTNVDLTMIQSNDGYIYCASTSFDLKRLNSDGTLDSSYVVATGIVKTIVQVTDGKIYISDGNNITRLNSDGTLDGAYSTVSVSSSDSVFSLYKTLDDKIYILGNFSAVNGSTYTNLARLNSDGSLDTSFVDLALPEVELGRIYQIANGKIYIGDGNIMSYRLNSDGTLDAGYVRPSMYDAVRAMGQDSNGKVYVGGQIYLSNGGGSFTYLGIDRLESDGITRDTTFSIMTNIRPDPIHITITSDKIYILTTS